MTSVEFFVASLTFVLMGAVVGYCLGRWHGAVVALRMIDRFHTSLRPSASKENKP